MTWLTIALSALALAAWASTVLLVRAALVRPHIGALTERAVIAVLLSAFGTVCVVLVWNSDSGQALFAIDAARILFRVCLFGLLLVPTIWIVLYATNRLGHGR
jgi:hypothetical protein